MFGEPYPYLGEDILFSIQDYTEQEQEYLAESLRGRGGGRGSEWKNRNVY